MINFKNNSFGHMFFSRKSIIFYKLIKKYSFFLKKLNPVYPNINFLTNKQFLTNFATSINTNF